MCPAVHRRTTARYARYARAGAIAGDGEFRLRIDGESLAEGDAEALLTYGTAVPHAEAGMLGPNLQTLARAHGWDISAVGADPEGIQIIVGDVTVDRLETAGSA